MNITTATEAYEAARRTYETAPIGSAAYENAWARMEQITESAEDVGKLDELTKALGY